MTREEQAAQVERDRRKREAALLLLLLLLGDRARLFIVRSIRVGAPWQPMLRSVLLGDESIDQTGGVGFIARAMAESHVAGYSRVGRLVGVDVEPDAIKALQDIYIPSARARLNRVANSLDAAVTARLAEVAPADRISADAAAVGEAFERAGWTPENRHAAEAESSAAVLEAYGDGMRGAYDTPAVADVTTALVFINPLDDATTDICRVRAGTILPPGDPWWFRNWPGLHYGCRSMVLPITRKVEFTADPPDYPPPQPGFGTYSGMLAGGVWG